MIDPKNLPLKNPRFIPESKLPHQYYLLAVCGLFQLELDSLHDSLEVVDLPGTRQIRLWLPSGV